jgi:hypothetical protein
VQSNSNCTCIRQGTQSMQCDQYLSIVRRFGVKIKELQRQSFVSSLSASRVVRAGNELWMKPWRWKMGSGSFETVLGLSMVIRTIRTVNNESQWPNDIRREPPRNKSAPLKSHGAF